MLPLSAQLALLLGGLQRGQQPQWLGQGLWKQSLDLGLPFPLLSAETPGNLLDLTVLSLLLEHVNFQILLLEDVTHRSFVRIN